MTPHKHAALIKAWADGAEIQVRDLTNYSDPKNCKWHDFSIFDDEVWYNEWEYRIKPKTIKYRNYLWKPLAMSCPERVVISVCSYEENLQEPRGSWRGFVKWLDAWQEVEV